MKDYLKEDLSQEERSFIYGIIRKTSLKFARVINVIKEREFLSLDDEDTSKEFLIDNNSCAFVDTVLDTKIQRDISALKPYSQYEKETVVKRLEKIAKNYGLEKFIIPLTFNEKLVVFLLYIENYQIKEISILLNITRIAIWKRHKSIKNKFNKVKEQMKNDR